jgi:hypothetical protein
VVCPKSKEDLSEQRREIGNQVVNKIKHTLKRHEQRLTLNNPRLSERYNDGELEVMVYFRTKILEEYVACFKRANNILGERDSPIAVAGEGLKGGNRSREVTHQVNGEGCSPRSEQEPMLVDNIQFMELPERVLPSFVWFDRIDSFYRFLPHQLYFSLFSSFIFLGAIEDGERGGRGRKVSCTFDKLPCQMVKSTSQVVDNIPADQGDFGRDLLSRPNAVLNCIRIIRVTLGQNIVRFGITEGSEGLIEITDVLFGPFDLKPDALNSLHEMR